MWYIFIFLFCFATVFSHGGQLSQAQSTAIDSFIQRLKREPWEAKEMPCLEKTLTLLENVKNSTLWATWVWNANSLPGGNLYGSWLNVGNFDQCMKPPWLTTHPQFRTKYCLTELSLADSPKKIADYDPYGLTEEFLNSPTRSGLPVNYQVWGVCMPAACHTSSIAKITKAMYEITTFGAAAPKITKVRNCQVSGAELQYGTGFYMFIALIVSLVSIAAASTYYRSRINTDDLPPDSIESVISKSFCIIKNCQDLVKENPGEIKVMNGMRFLTAVLVVAIHEIFFMVIAGMINSRDFDKETEGLLGMLIHIEIVVDTFFAMSGLLHIKGLLTNTDRQQNLFVVLWKRYVRLIGPFALTIFYLISVSKYTGSGPLWTQYNDLESKVCVKTWRLSLMMLNSNARDMCHSVTWYISCDYQLAILGTVLFYFYQKNRRVGVAAFGTAAVLSIIIPGFLTYWFQLPGIHFLDLSKFVRDIRQYWELGYTYMPSYSRAGSYLVGIAMGYLMTLYRPADYRNTVSKKLSIIGTVASLIIMTCMMSLGKFFMLREYNPLEAAVVAATNRVIWALAVCCIIGLCEYGTVPIVSDILGHSVFTSLGRLSYGLYVIHPLLIQRNLFALRSPWKFDFFTLIPNTVGTATVSVGLSFAMWLLVEAPVINLCNQLLFTKSKKMTANGIPKSNGVHHQNGIVKNKEL